MRTHVTVMRPLSSLVQLALQLAVKTLKGLCQQLNCPVHDGTHFTACSRLVLGKQHMAERLSGKEAL